MPAVKVKCKNCGDQTHFHNAVIEREKLCFCFPCYRQWLRATRTGSHVVWWDENTTINSGGVPKHLRAKLSSLTTDSE